VPVTTESGLIKADFTLPQSGEYTVVVQNRSSSATYSYSFVVGDATPAYGGPSLTVDDEAPMTRGKIVTAGSDHDYTFTLADATTLYFEALSASADFEWTLTGPSGEIVSDRDFDDGNLKVSAASGSYTLTIASTGVGPYAFRLLDLGERRRSHRVHRQRLAQRLDRIPRACDFGHER
jgi:hypothetical protein